MPSNEKRREKMLFINDLPVLYPERNVARQFQVEMWLDNTPMYQALGLKTPEQIANEKRRGYVV